MSWYKSTTSTTVYYAVSPMIRHLHLFFFPISGLNTQSEEHSHFLWSSFYICYIGLFRIPRTVPTPLSTLVHIPLKQSRQCRAWTRLEFWRFVWRSQLEYDMCATADSFLDLDFSCVLVVDDRYTDLVCCFRWDMVRFWSGLNVTNGYIFLYSATDLYKDIGDVVFFYLAALAR